MNICASLPFRNALAHFTITQEEDGVYLAQLQHYGGFPEEAPPSKILLIRGIRRWIGSFDDQEVLDALGRIAVTLDTNVFSTLPTIPSNKQMQEQQLADEN